MLTKHLNAQLSAMNLVIQERDRQDAKWGPQGHAPERYLTILTEEVGEVAQAILHDIYGGKAKGTYKTEIIQVAAVALAMIELLERQEDADHEQDRTQGTTDGSGIPRLFP